MDDIQQKYREELASIIGLQASKKIKTLLLQNLIITIRESQNQSNISQHTKCKGNYDVLSTSISECYSINYTNEKDIEQLQDRIIQKRMVKIENNQEIETMEEELFEMEKVVKTRMEYQDYLKKQIDMKLLNIQKKEEKEKQKVKDKSVLNKSLDAVAGALKISKWWT